MKLPDLFRLEPRKSPLQVPCEVHPGHHDNKYVHLTYTKSVTTKLDLPGNPVSGMAVPVEVKTELNICPICFNAWAYDLMRVAKELAES